MARSHLPVLLLCCLALCSCSDDTQSPDSGLLDLAGAEKRATQFTYDGKVSIRRGLYGRLVIGNPLTSTCSYPTTPLSISVYTSDPSVPPLGSPAGQAVGGAQGFFQIALPAGTYYICPRTLRSSECGSTRSFQVASGCPLVRLEYADQLWDQLECHATGPAGSDCD